MLVSWHKIYQKNDPWGKQKVLIGETGTIATGAAPFLAATNPAPFGEATYVPNAPLETSEPISGANGRNIFHLMGDLR
jgi:hypothetical protein